MSSDEEACESNQNDYLNNTNSTLNNSDTINESNQPPHRPRHSSNDSNDLDDNPKSTNSSIKRHIACSLCRKRKLKCDGQRPKCSTCAKQNHICEYTETFRKAGPRRGYVKTLEQRVSQLEQLLADATTRKPIAIPVTAESAMIDDDDEENDPDSAFNYPIGNVGVGTAGHGVGGAVTSGVGIPVDPIEYAAADKSANHGTAAVPMNFLKDHEKQHIDKVSDSLSSDPKAAYLNQNDPNEMQVSGLNMDESLPPDEMINELVEIYFNGLNKMIPMIDKARFIARMSLGFSQRPKLFLQYSIFLVASCTNDKYATLSPLFYKRACKYMNKAETSSHFKDVANVQYVQASILISTFEYRNALFPQAWLRVGSTMRACQMLNMHVIDVETYNEASDDVTLSDSSLTDEIRRTFWVAMVCDRTASSGTGWPCVSTTGDVFTKIPLEDETIHTSKKSHLVTLESIFRNPEILARFKGSRLIIYILYSECQYEIAKLIMFPRKELDLSPNGPWMTQYTRIDNLLSALIFVLDPVPSSDESADRNLTINVHLMVHTAILCLNKCALLGIQNSPDLLRQFKREELLQRCANAATEITLLIRMSRDISSISAHPILTFVIYTCARFFLTAVQSGAAEFIRFKSHLDFLITTLRIMRVYMPMAQMFCDSIIAAAGEMFKGKPVAEFESKVPNCTWSEPQIRPDTMKREEEIFDTPTSMNSNSGINSSIPVGSNDFPTGNGFFSQQENRFRFQTNHSNPNNNNLPPSSYSIHTMKSTSPGAFTSSSSSMSDDLNHLSVNNPTTNSSDGSTNYVSSGLTPLTGTPDPISLSNLPSDQSQQTPQSANFPVNLDWSSLMTTEAMWTEILTSTGTGTPIRASTEELLGHQKN